jgi:anti-sigma-K factor RskA
MNGSPHDYARLAPDDQEALDALLAAYALGALTTEEAAGVARHLATCPGCRARADAYRATVALLPAACDEVEPSPALRTRLLAAASAERDQAVGDGQPTLGGEPRPAVRPLPALPGRPEPPAPLAWRDPSVRAAQRGTPWRWVLPTAALLLLSIGLGVWSAQLQRDLERQQEVLALYQGARQAWRLSGAGPAAGASGMLVERTAGPPVLLVRDLPSLPTTQAYQVWVIRDGRPQSAGVFPAGAGGQLVEPLAETLEGADAVALTIEPAGGSPGPTGPIVLSASL